MPTFGRFETTRELYRTGLTVLWSARAPGDETPLVVKEIQAQAEIFGDEASRRAVTVFLQRARVQQQAAGEGRGHWAPVLDLGETETGAYLVTPLYPRSAQRLITGRVKLDAGAMVTLLESAITGLAEIAKASSRAHGNLKASNLLIAGSTEEPITRAVLSDPAESATPADAPADLRALGEVLYQLVMHQPFRARGGWPVPPSPEWDRFGPSGNALLELCNRLLDPSLPDNPPPLEELLAHLPTLRPAPRSRKPVLLIGAVVGLLAIGGVVGGILVLRGGESGPSATDFPFDEARWTSLCNEHFDWIEAIGRALGRAGPTAQARAKFSADPYLRELLTLLDAYNARLTPQAITGSTANAQALSRDPPESAQKPAAVKLTIESAGVVERLRAKLSPETLGDWTEYARVRDLAEACEGRGWNGPARYLRSLTGAVQPRYDAVDAVARLMEAAPLAARLQKLAADADAISGEQDAVLSQFNALVAHELAEAADPRQIDRVLTSLQDLASRLAAFIAGDWKSRVDREILVTRAVYEPGGGAAAPDATRFNTWLTEAQNPRNHVPGGADPRDKGWAQVLAGVRQNLTDLTSTHNVPAEEGPAEYAARADAIEREIASLGDLKWNSINQVEITRRAEAVRTDLESLRRTAKGAVDTQIALKNRNLDEFKGSLRAEAEIPAVQTASINAAWRRQRDQILDAESDLQRLDSLSKRLREFLTQLDASVPRLNLTTGRPWEAELRKADDRRRDEALQAILAAVSWEGGAPPASFSPPAEPRQALDQWRTDLTSLASDLAAMEDRLDALYGPTDTPEPPGPTAADLAAACKGREALKQPEVAAAAAPVLARYATAESLAGESSRAALLTAAGETRAPAAALVAWRRLGAIAWPPVEQSLRDEIRLQGILQGMIGAAPEGRREALSAELRAGAKARWARHLSLAAAPAEVRAAIALKGDDKLRGDAELLDSRGKFNLLLYELELARADSAIDEPTLTTRIESFVAGARALGAVGGGADALLGQLGELTSAAPVPKIDVTTLGPGAAGWAGEASTDGDTVTFTKGSQAIAFARVNPSQASPAFLSTSEVSFGLFQGVAADAGIVAPVSDALYQYSLQDPRQGPRVWRRGTGGRVSADTAWLAGNARVWPRNGLGAGRVEPYPAGLNPGTPSAEAPMQYISGAAAVMVARAVNCRLPSAAEWSAALEAELAGRSADEYITATKPNLRDQTWSRQLQYVTGLNIAPVDSALVLPALDPSAGSLWGQADREVQPYDDGALWFTPVTAGGATTFKNLIGNVAELVFDDPDALDALAAGSGPQQIDPLLRRPGLLSAAGYSALSPREPQPIRPITGGGGQGYSDVGFRLAFSAEGAGAPVQPLAVRLGAILEPPRFILPAGPGQ
ncbi:MAG: hypothetical protein WD749_03320 [Phycisphaerales bacterium]